MESKKLYNQMFDFFNGEIPEYILGYGKSFITIRVEAIIEGVSQELKIKISDVIQYYAVEARSMSGCRTIAGYTGDWRNIDEISKTALQWFKLVNIDVLRREGKKRGMTLK